jgi:putative hemolysin
MVTLENVIDKLVGEIREGYRQDQENMFVKRDENSWLVDGAYSIADLIQKLDLSNADATEPRPYSTLSGLVLHELGRIPNVGDATDWNGMRLEVVDMDGQRIDRVLVSRPAAPAAPPTA